MGGGEGKDDAKGETEKETDKEKEKETDSDFDVDNVEALIRNIWPISWIMQKIVDSSTSKKPSSKRAPPISKSSSNWKKMKEENILFFNILFQDQAQIENNGSEDIMDKYFSFLMAHNPIKQNEKVEQERQLRMQSTL
jgi:hypothetical protein